ncbi:MAG: McrC family protein [Candidatus Woesearchaeota archaeon]
MVTTHNQTFNFKSKLDKTKNQDVATSNLMYMLSYLNSIENIIIDTKHYSKIKEGQFFFDILGKIFIHHFQTIFKRGLLKKYIRYQEKIGFLKGKLQIKKQVNQITQNKFNCEFDDLTYNNIENQAVILTAQMLSNLVKSSELKIQLKKIVSQLEDEISIISTLRGEEIRNIQFNRINRYYKSILEICEYIISKKFISNIHEQHTYSCCNFLVDMNKVYEDFITALLTQIIQEDYKEYTIVSQQSSKSLVKEGKSFTTKPDILILKDNKVVHILDIKYKQHKIPNADFYQMCAYSLVYPEVKKSYLLYEQLEEKEKNYSTISKNLQDDSLEDTTTIQYEELNLKEILIKDFSNKEEFQEAITKKLKRVVKKILQEKEESYP